MWKGASELKPVYDACLAVVDQSVTYHREYVPEAADHLEVLLRKFLKATSSTPQIARIEELQTKIRANMNEGFLIQNDSRSLSAKCGVSLGQKGASEGAITLAQATREAPGLQNLSASERVRVMESHIREQTRELDEAKLLIATKYAGCGVRPESSPGEKNQSVSHSPSKGLPQSPSAIVETGSPTQGEASRAR